MSQQAPLGLRQHLPPAFRQSLGWLQGTSTRNTVFTTHVLYCSAPAHIIAFILRPSLRTWYQPLPQGSKRQRPGSPVERGGIGVLSQGQQLKQKIIKKWVWGYLFIDIHALVSH
jgi:hypothetical protein